MESLSTVKRYKLAPPTEQDLLTSLERLVGQEESRRLWTVACRRAGLHGSARTLDQLESGLQQLKLAQGLGCVVANSILVRVRSYRTLSILNK